MSDPPDAEPRRDNQQPCHHEWVTYMIWMPEGYAKPGRAMCATCGAVKEPEQVNATVPVPASPAGGPLTDARLTEMWRSVNGPFAELIGPLIRFAGLVRDAALAVASPSAGEPLDIDRVIRRTNQVVAGFVRSVRAEASRLKMTSPNQTSSAALQDAFERVVDDWQNGAPSPSAPAWQPTQMAVLKCRLCGCLWRDNLDDTVSLFDAEQKSCAVCEGSTPASCDVHWLLMQRALLPPASPSPA